MAGKQDGRIWRQWTCFHKSDWEQFKKELNYILENGKEQEDEN